MKYSYNVKKNCIHRNSDKNSTNGDPSEMKDPLESTESFWKQVTSFTPESRVETYEYVEKQKKTGKKEEEEKPVKPPLRLTTSKGRILNVNQPKLDFCFTEDEENHCFNLELCTYKFMDTSLIDVDVQPDYVRVTVKGKVFQMRLPSEVNIDSSTAQRSQTTGHLLLMMPKVGEILKKKKTNLTKKPDNLKDKRNAVLSSYAPNLSDIPGINMTSFPEVDACVSENIQDPDSDFEDDPDVPPLVEF